MTGCNRMRKYLRHAEIAPTHAKICVSIYYYELAHAEHLRHCASFLRTLMHKRNIIMWGMFFLKPQLPMNKQQDTVPTEGAACFSWNAARLTASFGQFPNISNSQSGCSLLHCVAACWWIDTRHANNKHNLRQHVQINRRTRTRETNSST
jgi:hypothetical protein